MTDLSISELKEKVDRVTADLQKLRSSGADSRQLEVMSDYLLYLKDELKQSQNGNGSGNSTR
jgi:hypothetical protein